MKKEQKEPKLIHAIVVLTWDDGYEVEHTLRTTKVVNGILKDVGILGDMARCEFPKK